MCDCAEGTALIINGQGIVLDLNGHSVECTGVEGSPIDGSGAVLQVTIIDIRGNKNTLKGPGTCEYRRRYKI